MVSVVTHSGCKQRIKLKKENNSKIIIIIISQNYTDFSLDTKK